MGIWRSENGQRFQNYRAKFTVLDVAHISRAWIDDVLAGNPLSALAPEPWRQWVATRTYRALEAPTITPVRTREQQLPAVDDRAGWQLLNDLYATFQPNPVGFERIAVNIAQLAVPCRSAWMSPAHPPTADGTPWEDSPSVVRLTRSGSP